MQISKDWLYHTVFENETKAGKRFDIILLLLILTSVFMVILESVASIYAKLGSFFYWAEWVFTILFTIEYCIRVYAVPNKKSYIFNFYGIIDFLAVFPFYMALAFPSWHFLIVVRVLRLLRVFRIFKMVYFLRESNKLLFSLWKARGKIIVFLFFVLLITVVLGSFMYVIESSYNESFTSIPQSIYWAIVTLTTVGYGDVSPVTALGKILASVIMILGYAIIAVPTGIITANVMNASKTETTKTCPHCLKQDHDTDARFCKYCGGKMKEPLSTQQT